MFFSAILRWLRTYWGGVAIAALAGMALSAILIYAPDGRWKLVLLFGGLIGLAGWWYHPERRFHRMSLACLGVGAAGGFSFVARAAHIAGVGTAGEVVLDSSPWALGFGIAGACCFGWLDARKDRPPPPAAPPAPSVQQQNFNAQAPILNNAQGNFYFGATQPAPAPSQPDVHDDPAPAEAGNFSALGITANPLFVGREKDLRFLRAAMFPVAADGGSQSAALTQGFTGEGGIGKSQLAQRFAELACNGLRDGRVGAADDKTFPRDQWSLFDCAWWLDCSNGGHDQAMRTLAAHVGHAHTGRETPADLRAAIRTALNDKRRHLLILDNLDAMDAAQQQADGSGRKWGRAEGWALPKGSRVLITTREQHLPAVLGRHVELGVLSIEDARSLLRSSRADLLDVKHDHSLDSVTEHLGRLALAVDLCRAWLSIHSSRIPADLLAELQRSDAAALALFEADEVKDQAHRSRVSVGASLSLHMDALKGTSVERVLHAAAFAAPDRIPVRLLAQAAGVGPDESEQALVVLAGKSILHRHGTGDSETVNLHRLTQLVVRARMAAAGATQPTSVLDAWLVALFDLFRWPGTRAEQAVDFTKTRARLAALAHAEAVLTHSVPSSSSTFLRGELSNWLPDIGMLAAAQHHLDVAITWGAAQDPRDEHSLSIWHATRARVRRLRGDLASAEEDINTSIVWGEARDPRNEQSLAIRHAARANIRKDRGDLKGAEEDIQKSIDWGEAQNPRDERGLAIDYSSRASIRRDRGDLNGAEQDINNSIVWGEAQIPRDERSLAIWHTSRASIRHDRGDLNGAEQDIQKGIDWEEAQDPRDGRSLSIRYALRARIREDQNRFAEAQADINTALDWILENLPGDERTLDILRHDKARIEAATRDADA